jgi:hypothetical protein
MGVALEPSNTLAHRRATTVQCGMAKGLMSALGHSRPSHFVPVLNNVRYASDSDHYRYESELTLWAKSGHYAVQQRIDIY